MDRIGPPRVQLLSSVLHQPDDLGSPRELAKLFRLLPPEKRPFVAPRPLTPAEKRRIKRAHGLKRFGVLAEVYAARLHALGLIGSGTFGVQLSSAPQVALAHRYRNVVVFSRYWLKYPSGVIHELLHLSARPHNLPFENWLLGECTTSMLDAAVSFAMDAQLPRDYDAAGGQEIGNYTGVLALPILHHALTRAGLEQRPFGYWLRDLHLEMSASEALDAQLETLLTPAQKQAVDEVFRESRLKGDECTPRGHRYCGHTLIDRALQALGNEYSLFGCEHPELAKLRAGLRLPVGGVKALWSESVNSVFDQRQ